MRKLDHIKERPSWHRAIERLVEAVGKVASEE
jgi:hypothetical protein